MKKTMLTAIMIAIGAFSAVNAQQTCTDGSTPSTVVLNLAGKKSWDELDDPDNESGNVTAAEGGNVVGVQVSGVQMTTSGGSYCREAVILIGDESNPGNNFNIFTSEASSESPCADLPFTGFFNLHELGFAFGTNENAINWQLWEIQDDAPDEVDATYTAGTVTMYICPFGEVLLPVELTRFEGKALENNNVLFWETANEINNSGFEIESMTAAPQTSNLTWEKIGFVKGEGEAARYQFLDYNPQGLTYYRLKQVDHDGSFSYSNIISIENNISFATAEPQIYPAVISDLLTIENARTIEIFNISGQLVLSKQTEDDASISLANLPDGLYVVKAYPLGWEGNTPFKLAKIIKQ
jgi:Secretion system C-terminal sorting domain